MARQLVADEELDQGRLAGPGRADEEDEVALGDHQVDVLQGGLAVRVGLGDVVQHEDRAVGLSLLAPAAQQPFAHGAW